MTQPAAEGDPFSALGALEPAMPTCRGMLLW